MSSLSWIALEKAKGCSMPHSRKQHKTEILVTSRAVPPVMRRFCDFATPLIRDTIRDSLHARTVGSMYAGAVEVRGIERYVGKSFQLGEKLARSVL
jgi:hypothetical protein